MIICRTIKSLRQALSNLADYDPALGFVPTMGALHQGHLTLVKQAKALCTKTVVSIFVNPTQFNDAADYARYPKTLEKDILMLEKEGADLLFLPSEMEIYPQGRLLDAPYALGPLENLLEGKYRPGHFQGVCQVVERLLRVVQPGHLFMGQKDFQQCMVVNKLLKIINLPITLHVVPTVRETNGLAMSSRNLRLSPAQQEQAAAIYQQLKFIRQQLGKQPVSALQEQVTQNLLDAGFTRVDYVSVADAETLQPATDIRPGQDLVALVAAFLGDIRLIDNLPVFRGRA